MNPHERREAAIRDAWARVYGTRYESTNIACIHFHNGYMAALDDTTTERN